MKRTGFLVAAVIVIAASGLPASPAVAQPARAAVCVPESVSLLGPGGTLRCLMVATPSITPPFRAVTEHNGDSRAWCLYSAPDYGGFALRLPPFSGANVSAAFASGRPC
jgi:hypothetical protein